MQSTGFCIQDFVICGIYIYEAARAFKRIIAIRGRDGRNAIIHLLCINILVVILNVLLVLAESKLHYIQVSFKTVVYSIKLKLEFSVLNRLRSLTRTNPCICQHGLGNRRQSSDTNILGRGSTRAIAAADVISQPGVTQSHVPPHFCGKAVSVGMMKRYARRQVIVRYPLATLPLRQRYLGVAQTPL